MSRWGTLKKILFWVLIGLTVTAVLLVGQIKVATYLYDKKIGSALAKVERSVPNLKLEYTPGESTFTSRRGRLFYDYKLKENNNIGEEHVSGAIDLKILFGPLRVSGSVDSVADVGNLDKVLAKFNVDPIAFTGAFKATVITPKVSGIVKTDSFFLPTSTGICKFGQNAFSVEATSTEDVDIAFRSAGVVCEGDLRYNDKPNYRLDLLGLDVSFLPRIINKKPHFDSLEVNLQQLDFKFSTLYAIGFEPSDEVRDPSIQDGISFTDVSTRVTLSQPDSEGMSKLSFDNSGNYGFAFPLVRYNVDQPYYRLDDFKFAGSIERLSVAKLYDASKAILKGASEKFETNKVFKEILKGFTDVIGINIENFGYTHNGKSFSVQGNTQLAFDEHSPKPKISRLDSDYKIVADKELVYEVAGADYDKPLMQAVDAGQITDDGSRYRTRLTLSGKTVALNNIPLTNLVSQDDMLYEEEQRALKEQQAQEKADAAALKKEIEAAKRAQQNLPSLVEGNLSSDSKADEGAEAETEVKLPNADGATQAPVAPNAQGVVPGDDANALPQAAPNAAQ